MRNHETVSVAASAYGPLQPHGWSFFRHELPGGGAFHSCVLPDEVLLGTEGFERLWRLHPSTFHEVRLFGRMVRTPRYQQVYGRAPAEDQGRDGRSRRTPPVPRVLDPVWRWVRESVDKRLNGVLVNWYDLAAGHYIGRHRDDVSELVEGTPIVTVSYGVERPFRLRPWRGKGRIDFRAGDGSVFVTPWETNLAFTREVPASARVNGRRISVTFRAFAEE